MHWIRRLVYKMGFRPKPYSIFFSPSRDWILGNREIHNRIADELRHTITKAQKKADK